MNTFSPAASDAAPVDNRVLLEAAQWFSVLRSDASSDEDRVRWQAWLGRPGSAQRQAWQRVEAISSRFAGVADAPPARQVLHSSAPTRRQVLRALAVVGGTGALAWMGAHTQGWQALQADYSTGTGEIREIMLADGTRVWLNTASAIDVRYSEYERRVLLLHGEVRVVTAQAERGVMADARRFFVETAHGQLQPLGTRFTVRQQAADTLLAVDEGSVQVRPHMAGAQLRIVEAGFQARFSASGVSEPQPLAGVQHGWTQGLLVADDMRLDDFLGELARYRRGHLGCDPAIASMRLLGVYSVSDTDHALASLARTVPVRIRQITPWWVDVLPARPSAG